MFFSFFLSHMNKKTRYNATITQHGSSAEIHNKTLVITICLRCSALMPNYCWCLGFGVCVVLARPFGTVLRCCSVTLQTFKITDFCQRHTPDSFLSNNWLQPPEANFYFCDDDVVATRCSDVWSKQEIRLCGACVRHTSHTSFVKSTETVDF